MADGTIRVSTKLDLAGVKKDIKELEKEIARADKEAENLEKRKGKDTAKYEKDIEKGGPKADAAIEKQAAIVEKLEKKQEAVRAKAEEYRKLLAEATAEYERQSSLAGSSKQLDKAIADNNFASGITSQEQYNSLLEETKAKMSQIEREAGRIAKANGVSKDELLSANPAYQKLSDQMGILTSRTFKFKKSVEDAGKSAKSSMRTAKKETSGFGTSIKDAIKTCGKMALAVFSIQGAYRAVRVAVSEYLSTNQELAGQVDALKSLFGQVLGPAIEWVVNLLMQAVAAVNAFVHALTGINFVAKANAAALKKQQDAAKPQSAGFDEQTKLSDSGGSGSNVATLPDGSSMDLSFLDPLMGALKNFKEDISPLIDTIGDAFKWLLDNVFLPLGDWVANSFLPAFFETLGEVFLVLNDALLALQPVAQWLWDNILKPIAEWTGGVIIDVITAIGDWVREHHDTLAGVGKVLGVIVGVLVGVPAVLSAVGTALGAIGAVIASPITWIAALIALFVELYDSCEGFRDGMNRVWEGIKGIFQGAIDWFKALFTGDWSGMDAAWAKIADSAKYMWEGLVDGLKAGWEWCKEKISAIWDKIVTAFKDFFGIHSPSTMFRDFGKNMMEGLTNGIKNALNKVKEACRAVWSGIKSVFSNVTTWFKTKFTQAWTAVKNIFSKGGKIFDGIKSGIVDTFKTIVNGLITGINKVIATPFNAINGILNGIRSISIVGIKPFKSLWSEDPLAVPQIPKLAMGGIVNNPGRGVPAIIGEAGAEAVLPLENNTEWMDILADKIGGNVTIPIYLDGKKIYSYMVDVGKRKAFAANGG